MVRGEVVARALCGLALAQNSRNIFCKTGDFISDFNGRRHEVEMLRTILRREQTSKAADMHSVPAFFAGMFYIVDVRCEHSVSVHQPVVHAAPVAVAHAAPVAAYAQEW